jgi:hypothetical protein
MHETITNDEVEELVKARFGWDVSKKWMTRFRDEFTEHFVPFWQRELPKCDEHALHERWGYTFMQTVPHFTVWTLVPTALAWSSITMGARRCAIFSARSSI